MKIGAGLEPGTVLAQTTRWTTPAQDIEACERVRKKTGADEQQAKAESALYHLMKVRRIAYQGLEHAQTELANNG